MARKVIQQVTIIDDISGEEVPEEQAQEVYFSWGHVNYKIDLSKSNADKFERSMKQYVEAAARVSGGRGRPKGTSSRASSGSGLSPDQLAQIRDWAKANGHEVSGRGRIAKPVIEAWEAAHAT